MVGPHFRTCRSLTSLLLLICGGCTEFAHGVVDQPMPNDIRLVGYWEPVRDEEKGSILISEESPTILRIDFFEPDEEVPGKCKKDQVMTATRTEIDGMPFLDVRIPPHDSSNAQIFPMDYDYDDNGHWLIGGRVDADFKEAIESGELPGRIIKSTLQENDGKPVFDLGDKIYVDASTAELRQFMAKHSGPRVKPPIEFHPPLPATLPCEPDRAR